MFCIKNMADLGLIVRIQFCWKQVHKKTLAEINVI